MHKTSTYLAWISLILLFINHNTYGQKNFVKGYVILPPQDTVHGLIDDQNWDRNPTNISFKKNAKSEQQRYTVRQLEEFGIADGDVYHKSIVTVDKTPTRFEELSHNSKPVMVLDTVFLLEQAKGTLSLYHLLDENDKNHFFIQKSNGTIEELIQRRYVAYKNDQRMAGIADQYKDQLKYSYLTECSDLQPQIARTSYTKAALNSLIVK